MEYGTYDAQKAIVSEFSSLWLASDYKAIPFFGNNGPNPDLDALTSFVNLDVVFSGNNRQVTLGINPIDRTFGYVEVFFGSKTQTGRQTLLKQQSFVKEAFKGLQLDALKFTIPSPLPASRANNWYFEVLHIPFYFDSSPAGFIAP